MKLSQIIQTLQAEMNIKGDVDVTHVWDSECSGWAITSVEVCNDLAQINDLKDESGLQNVGSNVLLIM